MSDAEISKGLNNVSIEDDLTARHKKERKELQAKIQALKKTAGKGDKKKKKEVAEEIVRLESDLDRKHNEELSAIAINKCHNQHNGNKSDDVEKNESAEQAAARVSKAQRRRDKKAADDKQRQSEILAQEETNKTGPRVLELNTIKKLLKQRNLVIQPIPSDGDCLYNAIRNQLLVTGRQPPDVKTLRNLTADYIEANKESLIFYMENTETGDCLSDEEFVKYCTAIRNTPAWGGHVEISALTHILKSPIEVIQATGPPTIQGETEFKGPNLVITYHRHMYSLGEHYNGTKSKSSDHLPADDGDHINGGD